MTWLALAFALQHADAQQQQAGSQSMSSTWLSTGSLVRRDWHLGVRPGIELDPEGGLNWGLGLTLQITTDAPFRVLSES
jgi:hypothetical protein